MSNNLNIDQMAAGQSAPEVTHNTANGEIDAAVTENTDLDLTAGNVTVTALQFTRNIKLRAINATVVGRTVTLQAIKRLMVLVADSSCTQPVAFVLGTTTLTLQPKEARVVYTDGTANGLTALVAGLQGGTPFDIGVFTPGLPGAGAEVLRFEVVRPFTLPINLTGSLAKSRVTATASATFTIKQNGVSIGTFNFGAGASTATFSFAAAVTFAIGDQLSINAPGVQDATLADVGFTFLGSR